MKTAFNNTNNLVRHKTHSKNVLCIYNYLKHARNNLRTYKNTVMNYAKCSYTKKIQNQFLWVTDYRTGIRTI